MMDFLSKMVEDGIITTQELWDGFVIWVTGIFPTVVSTILILLLGWILATILSKLISKTLHKSKIEESAAVFCSSVVRVFLKIFVIMAALAKMGLDVSAMLAAVGAAGVAASLSVKDTLSNLVGGLVIVINKPFKLGDIVDIKDVSGVVTKIEMMYTTFVTFDNRTIVVPNSLISSNYMVNNTKFDTRRMDLMFPVGYGSDMQLIKNIILNVLRKDKGVRRKSECTVFIAETGESSVNLCIRLWCKSDEFLKTMYRIREKVYNALTENNISIPFNQLDVHIDNAEPAEEVANIDVSEIKQMHRGKIDN